MKTKKHCLYNQHFQAPDCENPIAWIGKTPLGDEPVCSYHALASILFSGGVGPQAVTRITKFIKGKLDKHKQK